LYSSGAKALLGMSGVNDILVKGVRIGLTAIDYPAVSFI
jgi:hypothetical protein